MAKKDLPSFLKKRSLLYDTKDKKVLTKYGDLYFEAGYIDDALDFYERAESDEGLTKVLESAKNSGNLVQYKRIVKVRKTNPDSKILNEIGTKALELSKLAVAKEAFKETGNEAMLKKVEGLLEKESGE